MTDVPCALAAAAALMFAVLWWQYRRRLYDELGRDIGTPIRTVPLDEFDPSFAENELGPTRDAEVVLLGKGRGVPGGTSDREAWVIAVLARHARRMFEFGTATGKSTYLMARNSPDDARVTTITLPPEAVASYDAAQGDRAAARRMAEQESVFTSFLYTGSPVEHKIEQLYGDTKEFDHTPFRNACDLIFVDGSHAYSYVVNDTRKALDMLAAGGIILWHDYRSRWAKAGDVYRALNELRHELPLVRLAGTSLVAYRSPAA